MAQPANKTTIIYCNEERQIEFNRVFPIAELRVESENEKRTLSGYAAVFDKETTIGDWFREVIRANAFTKTITEFDQAALWNHDSGKPLARRSKGTLQLAEDDKGLKFTIELGNQSWSSDAMESVKRGDVQGMSFGFQVLKAKWTFVDDKESKELDLREILEVKLWEVSPVTFPAYDGTSINFNTAKSIIDVRNQNLQFTETTSKPESNHSEATEPDEHHSEAEPEFVILRSIKHKTAISKMKEASDYGSYS